MFIKLHLDSHAANLLAKDNVNSSAALVLLKIMYHINRVNMVIGTPDIIARTSGVRLHDFHRGLRELKQLDFIRKFTKKEYMLNPDVMFNGDDRQYYIVKHMWDTQTSKGLKHERSKTP